MEALQADQIFAQLAKEKPVRSQTTNDVDNAIELYDDIHDYLDILADMLNGVEENEGDLPPSAAQFLCEYQEYITSTLAHKKNSKSKRSADWRRSMLMVPIPRRSLSAPAALESPTAIDMIPLTTQPSEGKIECVKATPIFAPAAPEDESDQEMTPSMRKLKILNNLHPSNKRQLTKKTSSSISMHFQSLFASFPFARSSLYSSPGAATATETTTTTTTTTKQNTDNNQQQQKLPDNNSDANNNNNNNNNSNMPEKPSSTTEMPAKFDFISNLIAFTKTSFVGSNLSSWDFWEKHEVPVRTL